LRLDARTAHAAGILVIGGEALLRDDFTSWIGLSPQTRFINEYGPTEIVVGCSVHAFDPNKDGSGPMPIGRPIDNARIYVLDDRLQLVAAGIVGEIFVGGAGVARGYLNEAGHTAAAFLPDPYNDGRSWALDSGGQPGVSGP
jgi:non-ribosomal peptide synthetase component F